MMQEGAPATRFDARGEHALEAPRSAHTSTRAPLGRIASAATALGLVVTASVAWAATPRPPGTPAQVAGLVARSHAIRSLPSGLTPSLGAAKNDTPEVIYPRTKEGCASLSQCDFGITSSKKVIVLFGDSHAAMWLPALVPIARRDGYKVILLFNFGCPAADLTIWNKGTGTYFTACNTARTGDIKMINRLKPKVLLLASRSAQSKSSAKSFFTNAQWQAGLERTIGLFRPSRARIAIIGDITLLNAIPPECLAAYPSSVQTCAVANPNPIRHNQGHQAGEQAAAATTRTPYVNPIPWLCTTTCSPVIGSMLAYSDKWHISDTYATYLSTVFGDAIKKLLA